MSTPKTPTSVPLPKARRGLRSFINDVTREMRQVTWPKRSEVNRLTGVVIVVCFGTTMILLILSIIFEKLFEIIFRGV